MELTENWEYILSGLLILFPLILIILELIENRIKKKIEKEKLNKKRYYLKKLNEIDYSNNDSNLNQINKLAKELFKDIFQIRYFQGYGKLEKNFLKKGFLKEAKFCGDINKYLYSQEKPDLTQIKNLMNLFKQIMTKDDKIIKKENIFKRFLNLFHIKKKELNNNQN